MKPVNLFSILVIFGIVTSSCGSNTAARIAQSNAPRITSLSVSKDDLAALTDGNDAFALDLYGSFRSQDSNLVFSPYSISSALAMTYAGALGQTESQMAQALHYTLPQDRLHPAFDQLDLNLRQEGQSTSKDQQPLQLNVVNAVWAEQTYSFLHQYLDLVAKYYGAGIRLVDFVHQSAPARQEINNWVSDQTQNKVQNLIAEGALDPSTRMVLVNAIYFKANWEQQFDPNHTQAAPFHLLDGSQSQVKMMSENLSGVRFVASSGYQAVELPYQGETATMDVIVPAEGQFEQFESTLNAQDLGKILGSMQPASVALGLPKFSFSASFDLSDRLSALGMSDAFDPNLADFSGMTGKRNLYINKVLHQAFVAVDENGTEAAAATSVIMGPTAILGPNITLTVDHPFLFVIRDLSSGQILFLGRVLDPSK